MTARSPLSPELAQGEQLLFEKTTNFIRVTDDGQYQYAMLKAPIPQFLQGLISWSDTSQDFLMVAAADMYDRNIIDIAGDDIEHTIDARSLMVPKALDRKAGDVQHSTQIMFELANIAFKGVLFRPKGLDVPRVDRQLYASDLRHNHSGGWLVDAFRYRLNALKRVETKKNIGKAAAGRLRELVPGAGEDGFVLEEAHVHDFIQSGRAATRPRAVEALAPVFMGRFAAGLVPLLTAGSGEAEYLRRRFIDRAYEEFHESGASKKVGEVLFHKEIDERAKRHILAGDAYGGGHHLPRLDPKYFRVIGPVVQIDGGVTGSSQRISVARTQRMDKDGRTVDDRVQVFFPHEWSDDEVLDAVCNPSRLVLHREKDGVIEQYMHARGIAMKRILGLLADSDDGPLITAYPVAHVSADLQKQLGGRQAS